MKEINIDKKIIFNIIITTISFFATYFVSYIIAFENKLTYSNSIISLVIFVSFIYLLKNTYTKENIPKIKNSYFLGLIFSTFLVLGNSIKTNGMVEYGDFTIYLAIIFISFIVGALLVQLYKIIEKIENSKIKEENYKLSKRKRLVIVFFLIILCWIPVLLASYPGYFCYDATNEFTDYILNNVTDWHPPIHTFLMSSIITFVAKITKSYNIAIFMYSILQMLVVAGGFTYCISFLEKYKVSKWIRVISIMYYALFPVVVMFAMCSTKDTLFSVVVIISIITMLEALIDKEKFLSSKWLQIKFALIIFLAIVLRNNAIYAYIPVLIAFIIAFRKKEIMMPIIGVIGLYLIYTIIVYGIFNVSRTNNVEALSVPLQQIARVYNYNYESLTDEEINQIHKYTTDEQIKQYLPECSDLIKQDVELRNIGYTEFFKLWIKIGLKNPRNIY